MISAKQSTVITRFGSISRFSRPVRNGQYATDYPPRPRNKKPRLSAGLRWRASGADQAVLPDYRRGAAAHRARVTLLATPMYATWQTTPHKSERPPGGRPSGGGKPPELPARHEAWRLRFHSVRPSDEHMFAFGGGTTPDWSKETKCQAQAPSNGPRLRGTQSRVATRSLLGAPTATPRPLQNDGAGSLGTRTNRALIFGSGLAGLTTR